MDDIFWGDEIGDKWESEGHHPGRIFEFDTIKLGDQAEPGGMILSRDLPGKFPSDPFMIEKIVIKLKNGELVEMSPTRPIFLAYWTQIYSQLE